MDAREGGQLRRVLAGDCSRGNWGVRSDRIWVDNGCQAEFVVRGANWNNGGNANNGGGFTTSTVRCESWGYRYKECRADARGGVRIQRVIAGDCSSGNWGYRNDVIWVDNGCRADFSVRGYGQQNDGGGGPSTGLIIGGVAVAAGLAALLASSGKKNDDKKPGTSVSDARPARIDVNTNVVATAARPSFQQCLDEAALQIGATGGTAIALEEIREIEPGNDGYRFSFRLRGTWPDETRVIGAYCRATADRVIELDFD